MAFGSKNAFQLRRMLQLVGGVRIAALAGDETWTRKSEQVAFIDCDGAGRTITLPAEDKCDGVVFVVVNTSDAAEDITVENDAAATVVTVSQNEAAIVGCNGTAWDGFILTGALS